MSAKRKPRITKKSIISAIVTVAVFAVLYYLTANNILPRQYKSIIVPIIVNVMLVVSLNLTVGFLGELTLGHAGFMSVGAYAGCLFLIHSSLPQAVAMPVALLIGGIIAAICGIIIGIPALRLRGDYLAIVTLAFGEIIRSLFNNAEFTGGAGGLKGIPKSTSFIVPFIVMVLSIIIVKNIVDSRQGRTICAIRDNEIAAESVGTNLVYHKLLAFVAAAFIAGVAGVLYGQNIGTLKPVNFDFNKSIELLVMVVLGGMGNIVGSIISAIALTLLPELLRKYAEYRMLIYSIVLIVFMILSANPKVKIFKDGLVEKVTSTFKKKKPIAKEEIKDGI